MAPCPSAGQRAGRRFGDSSIANRTVHRGPSRSNAQAMRTTDSSDGAASYTLRIASGFISTSVQSVPDFDIVVALSSGDRSGPGVLRRTNVEMRGLLAAVWKMVTGGMLLDRDRPAVARPYEVILPGDDRLVKVVENRVACGVGHRHPAHLHGLERIGQPGVVLGRTENRVSGFRDVRKRFL